MGPLRKATLPAPPRGKGNRTLMFAYGSNLSLAAMRRRCPDAKPLYPLLLNDCKLVFRGVADVAYSKGSVCPGGVWSITPACEKALDGYEGVDSGLYVKQYFTIRMRKSGILRPVLYYQMTERGICPPAVSYLSIIEQGYADFGLDLGPLHDAVDESWEQQKITPRIARRYNRKGRLPLALPEDVGAGGQVWP